MPSRRDALYQESQELFAGEGFEEGEAFLSRKKSARQDGSGSESNTHSNGSKRGAKWFEVPRFDDIFSSNRASRSDKRKEEQVTVLVICSGFGIKAVQQP